MSRASPPMRNCAKRLLTHEERENKSFPVQSPTGFHVFEKLRNHLAALMGNGGFRALHSRALALASTEVVWLRGVHVKPDGSLEGLEELQAQLDPDEFFEGRVVLLAQLLGLLVDFIGEALTLRLVHEVWPKVRLGNSSFGKGGKNEEKK